MKKLKLILLIFLSLLVFNCSKDDPKKDVDDEHPVLLSTLAINQEIEQSIQTKNDFSWAESSTEMLWSAVSHGSNLLTIGYGLDADNFIKSAENSEIKDRIIELVTDSELTHRLHSKNKNVIYYEIDEYLSIIDIEVSSLETIKKLRDMEGVRYLEPADYKIFENGDYVKSSLSSGCETSADAINPADYTNVSPGYSIPWTFYHHNIPQAWQHTKGEGVTVGLIDTGVSKYLSELGSGFSNSYSPNRSITKYGVYVDSFWPWKTKTDGSHDKCGHGTRMGATLAAPLNNENMPVGVANGCNIVSYRAAKNVVLDGYHEQKGVARALTELGNNSQVKIISMSMGHVFTINRIADAVRYANSKGKLIFCAGGTSTSITNWLDVIFPAKMNETVAVTGIKDNGYNECNVCHKGSKIDFTVVMQRSSDFDRVSVALGYYNDDKSYTGGSSVSTAMTAGIAALVWSQHPGWNKTDVLNKLKQSADLYPNKSSYFGYGSIDALAAVQ